MVGQSKTQRTDPAVRIYRGVNIISLKAVIGYNGPDKNGDTTLQRGKHMLVSTKKNDPRFFAFQACPYMPFALKSGGQLKFVLAHHAEAHDIVLALHGHTKHSEHEVI